MVPNPIADFTENPIRKPGKTDNPPEIQKIIPLNCEFLYYYKKSTKSMGLVSIAALFPACNSRQNPRDGFSFARSEQIYWVVFLRKIVQLADRFE